MTFKILKLPNVGEVFCKGWIVSGIQHNISDHNYTVTVNLMAGEFVKKKRAYKKRVVKKRKTR